MGRTNKNLTSISTDYEKIGQIKTLKNPKYYSLFFCLKTFDSISLFSSLIKLHRSDLIDLKHHPDKKKKKKKCPFERKIEMLWFSKIKLQLKFDLKLTLWIGL